MESGVVQRWFLRPDVLMVAATAPTYVATREALTALSPQDLTATRFLVGAVIIGLYLLVTRQRLTLRRHDIGRMLAVGLCGYAGYGMLLSLGQATVPAGTTSLLLNISPVFAFILGYFVLVERTTRLGYLGMMIAVLGVVTITVGGNSGAGFNGNSLLIVGAALLLSIFLIVQQPLFARVPPVETVFWGCVIGGIAALPTTRFDVDPSRLTASFWLSIFVLIVISTVLGYCLWNITLARSSVAEGGSLLLIVPIFSLLLGWLLLGEVPTPAALVGGAAALIGVVMLSRATSRRTQAGLGLLTGAIPIVGVLTQEIPIIGLPRAHEEVTDLKLPPEWAAEISAIAIDAAQAVGAQLVTISLWRPESADLVRVYSSRPHVYQLGGITADLGHDWVEHCVVGQRSLLAGDESRLDSDAFGYQNVLAALNLTAAVNAVIIDDSEFLGCLNFLDASGVYTVSSVEQAEVFAAHLAPLLRRVHDSAGDVPTPAADVTAGVETNTAAVAGLVATAGDSAAILAGEAGISRGSVPEGIAGVTCEAGEAIEAAPTVASSKEPATSDDTTRVTTPAAAPVRDNLLN